MTSNPLAIFGMGLLVGFIAGVLLEDAYRLAKAGLMDLSNSEEESTPVRRTTMFWVIIGFSVAQIVTGVFVGVTNVQSRDAADKAKILASEAKEFQTCVFKYEQRFSEVYTNVVEANKAASDADFAWKLVVAKSFNQENPDLLRTEFRDKFKKYIELYQTLQQERIENPPPKPPAEACGQP